MIFLSVVFLTGYLAILALHAGWAIFIMRKGLASLAVGPVRRPTHIMLGLFILNLPSVIVFLPATGFAHPATGFALIPASFGSSTAAMAHGFYHILLFIDEVFRVGRDPVRGLFLANHWAWAILLFAFAMSQ